MAVETHTSAFETIKKKIVAVLKENPPGLRAGEIATKIGYGEVDIWFRQILADLLLEKRIRTQLVNVSKRIGWPFVVENYRV